MPAHVVVDETPKPQRPCGPQAAATGRCKRCGAMGRNWDCSRVQKLRISHDGALFNIMTLIRPWQNAIQRTGQSHMMYQCSTCGNLVPREDVDMSSDVARCPECVRSGKTVKWPGVRVESEPFGRNIIPERLRQMSIGYLKSAQTLCCDLGEHPEHLDWPRASVTYFCVYHAVELFLKGCILLRAPPGEKLHHNVSKLQDRYCELYPEIKEALHIETPWDFSFEAMSVAFGVSIKVEDYEHHTDQVYRYMSGKSQASPRSIHSFSPGMCLLMCKRLETEMARVWKVVCEADPG